jgi:serine/threonine-protein kinase/endoribonuclease IRE1
MPGVDFPAAAKANRLRNLDSAYIGLVEESGSLFAMSPDHFPLVVFGDANPQTWDRLIEPSEAVADTRPDLVSEVVRPGGSRERCRNGSSDRRCLTGVRPLEESSRSKLSRLLDGAPTLSLPPGHNANALNDNLPSPSNGSPIPHWMWSPKVGSRADGRGLIGMDAHVGTFSTAVMFLFATVLGWLWITRKQVKARELQAHTVTTVPPEKVSDISPTPRHFAEPPPDAKTPENTPSPRTDTPIKSTDHPPNASTLHPDQIPAESFHDALEGDDTDKEDTNATPGKRKGIRRKRGKKKKVGFAGTPEEGEEEQVNENGIPLELKVEGNSVILPSAPQAQPTPGPSLTVSDTILGMSLVRSSDSLY